MIKETDSALILRDLHGQSFAYARVFDRNNKYLWEVLADLAKFCRADESTFHRDPRMHAVLEGRREVWLRIQEYIGFSAEEILELRRNRRRKDNE